MRRFSAHRIVSFFLAGVIMSCKKEPVIPVSSEAVQYITLTAPEGFPAIKINSDNPLSNQGVELGRLLFYDVRLSGNNKVSCASCHSQRLAFSDGVALTNAGVSGQNLERHSPALINLAWANGFFWDGGSKNLESQAFGPITNMHEMQQDLNELEFELKQVPEYVKRFSDIFKDGVKATNVAKALAQFQLTLISSNSKYDKFKLGEISLNAQELRGLNLIHIKCKSCHSGELFTDNAYHNNGIDDVYSDEHEGIHQGRYRITHDPSDLGSFKTPTLRNVMLTAPYMHDGRFKNIDEVLEHYNSGLKKSSTVDPLLFQNNKQLGVPISPKEKLDIKAFLMALTDNDFITNKKFSNAN
ncbi:cytochrome-c peroxidase [Pedobacter rhizosphaerae]|uniref:Cytochrome c peroxidase n=1 Tax=Pedobacter rhizosphaerae TaxID=390241 RepID=A0A1H9ST82_9SPHI|nr:cytochrome c peroxidase [Pedobacter rhizosphaerae]SER88045.1 cytochrome c peroxidase [Pedobacter rhizosphaerae]